MEKAVATPIIFKNRLEKALSLSYGVIKSRDETPVGITRDNLFVVWHCKTLQNWKAIISADFKGAPLLEVTYNGDMKETYIDVYEKVEHVRIAD